MKKKLLLFVIIISALVCVFALSVSAKEWFGTVEYLDGIKVEDHIKSPVTEATPEFGEPTEDARVKLSCTCEAGEHTFPAYYIAYKGGDTRLEWFTFADLNNNLTCGGEKMSLNNLIAFEFPNGITKIEATLYYECKDKNLEYLSFERAKTLTEMGNVQSGKNWFSGAPLEVIDIGPYVKNISPWFCYGCKTLETVNIPESSQLTKIGSLAFYGNTSLTSIRIPDTVSVIEANAFNGCTGLKEFRFPSALETFGASGSGQSPITGCTSLYFVSEYGEEKSSIYYLPSNVKSIVGEAFKGCTSLNETLVLHEGITSIPDGWAFCNTNKVTLVFLGDIETLHTASNGSWNISKMYFCNKNDKSASDFTIGKSYSSTYVFCNAEGNTTHLIEKAGLSQEANCTENKMTFDSCFCGAKLNRQEVENTATGHNYTGAVTYILGGIMEEGTKCTVCVNNCGKDEVVVIPPVYVALGYSKNTFSKAPYSFVSGYDINRDALKIHEEEKGITIKLGFAFNSAETFTDGEVSLDSFALKAEVNNQTTDREFGRHEFIVSYDTEEHLAKDIVIGAYAVEIDAEKNKSYYFINRSEDTTVGVNGFATVNYNGIE